MKEPDLHKRHRDKNGELSKKHGNTLVSLWHVAPGFDLMMTQMCTLLINKSMAFR